MEQLPKRQTAYKFWIKDLAGAEAQVNNGGMLFFKVKGQDAVRVNILAAAIHKYVSENGNYVFVTLDDGSGQIRLKAWNEDTEILSKIDVGDPVMAIGKLGLNNNEIFVRPEAVKIVEDKDWEKVRKLELNKLFGQPEGEKTVVQEEAPTEEVKVEEESIVIEEEVVSDTSNFNMREKIVSAIESAPSEGMEEGELMKVVGGKEEDVEKVVQDLLSEGEIFQPKKGFLKLIG
jgi:RPA family protein